MDKNFISIDDLVRQRLGGGEEQEREGSWMRMRGLLDKEMPKEPVGFNWRRTFSAVALLLLIGAAGISAYELSATKNMGKDNGIAAATNTGTAATAANTATSNTTTNKDVTKTQLSTTENKEATNHEIKAANATTITAVHHKAYKKTGASTIGADKQADHERALAANTIPAAKKMSGRHEAVTNTNKVVVTNTNNVAVAKTNRVAVAKTDNKINTNSITKTASKAVSNNVASTPAVATATPGNNNTNPGTKATALAGNSAHHRAANRLHNTPAKTMSALALGAGAPVAVNNPAALNNNNNATPAVKHGVARKHRHISPRKLAVSNIPVATKTATLNTKTRTVALARVHSAPAATATGTAAKTARNMRKKIAALPLAAGSNNATAPRPIRHNTRRGTRQVQQLVVTQRYVKTSSGHGYMQLDTISQKTITEDYDLAESNAPDLSVFGPPPYDKPAEINSHTVVSINTRDNVKNKKSGLTTMENLSAAFNDAKNKVQGVHFATGLTAGVNGTFFGPSSFKGFQFGVTGTFTFSDNLSIMSELKYIHRINGAYTLNDNYYNYTPDASGGYTKELVNNPYSFSTLHSIEMPISVRYCIEKFSFFVGANLSYMFAINTGAYPMADPSTTTKVSAIGDDNAPKLKANDFDSRFGLGYLFGASYQVAPNVMIDIRNVQTFWDNANSSGSKIISGQLYKSPSIQLSIGYRLGGNKNKDK